MSKTKLVSLTALALAAAQGAGAQGPAPGPTARQIQLVGIVGPETESHTLQPTCYSKTFTFTINNSRAGPSVLAEARRDGQPPRNPRSTAALREFLASVRNVHFTGSECVSENEIGMGLYGLLRSPPPGQRDDVIRQFRIRF